MRKFLVKHFVLDYWFTIFGKRFNAVRASRIIFPLMVLTGYVHTFHESPLSWALVGLTFVSLYFGFVHFRFWPAKWDELDEIQKFQYGVHKQKDLTPAQFKEWTTIYEKLVK